MSKLQKKKFPISKEQGIPVKVVNVSLMASVGVADGKMLPVVFLDCSNRKDIEDLLVNHSKLENKNGKVKSIFGLKSRFNKRFLYLYLHFEEPIKCNITIEFDLFKYAPSVDQLVKNQACYIQSASSGDKLSTSLDMSRILLEISSEHIREVWETIYLNTIIKKFKKMGFSKKESSEMAKSYISELRTLDIRMRD